MAQRSIEIGGEEHDVPRTLAEVQKRTLALGAVVALSFGAPKEELLGWLERYSLVSELTGPERDFFFAPATDERQLINFTWQSERLVVLLWALGKLNERPTDPEQRGTASLDELLPPHGDESTEDFIASCILRSDDELFDAAVEIQELHAEARSLQRRALPSENRLAIDIEVVQERHHAINWLVGYANQAWDEVTTDT